MAFAVGHASRFTWQLSLVCDRIIADEDKWDPCGYGSSSSGTPGGRVHNSCAAHRR